MRLKLLMHAACIWPLRTLLGAGVILMLVQIGWAQNSQSQALADNEIRDRMIKESIAQYRGNCPCPYNLAANGSRCGARSAHSRPGGQAPLCFREDISDEVVRRYRAQYR